MAHQHGSNIRNFILVLSGKGGVGKSTVTSQLAVQLVLQGFKVGLLDIDLCGPSIPYLLGLESKEVHSSSQGWVPIHPDHPQFKSLEVMSLAFLLKSRNDAVAWRGPKKTAMIKQFLNDVVWSDLDYLVVDTPPGTSDEHISITEHLLNEFHVKPKAVVVTTPQAVSLVDVQKEINFCNKIGLEVLGLVENMSGYVCPNCSECTHIFGSGGGAALAAAENIPYIGSIPIDPKLTSYLAEAQNFFDAHSQPSQSTAALQAFVQNLKQQTEHKEGSMDEEKGQQ